jgi:hypothetical protein
MRFRLFVSFLVGVVFFTVLPIYAPFVVLQTEEMPRFLLGLVAGVLAGAVLALINGPGRGLLLVLASALVGACIYVFVYAVRTFGPLAGVWPTVLSFALAYLVLPAAVGVGLVLLARTLLDRRGRAVHRSARVPTPEADVSVPPPLRQPPMVATGEDIGASSSRQRRRKLAVLLLMGAIIVAGIEGFVTALVINLKDPYVPTLANKIGFSLVNAVIKSGEGAIIAALVMLLGGGVVYLLHRYRSSSASARITFLQAAFSWQVLVVAAGLVLLMSIRDVAQVQAYLGAAPY